MMNIIKIILQTYALVLVVFIFSDCSKESHYEKTSELQHLFSFPDADSDVYFENPVSMSLSDRYVFVSDQFSSSIKVFDYTGTFIREIGRPGRGPEEFMMQSRIHYIDNRLYINDQGNARFTIYDLEYNTIRSSLMQELLFEFIVHNEVIYAYISYSPGYSVEIDELSLIKMYDLYVNQIGKFGEYIAYTDNTPPHASRPMLTVHNDTLYVTFGLYPIMRVYTLDGDLIKSIDLDTPELNYRERVEANYRSHTFENLEARLIQTLFTHSSMNDAGIFLNVFDDNLRIDHFDRKGNFIKRYTKETPHERYFVRDFDVRVSETGDLLFYVLNQNGYPKVDVYRYSDLDNE